MLSERNKEIFIKRFYSFAWRLGSMIVVAFIAFIGDNLELLSMSAQMQIFIALILSEITKWINTTNK